MADESKTPYVPAQFSTDQFSTAQLYEMRIAADQAADQANLNGMSVADTEAAAAAAEEEAAAALAAKLQPLGAGTAARVA